MRAGFNIAIALLLLPHAAAAVDELGSDQDLRLQVQQPGTGNTVGTVTAAFWAKAFDPTWTVNATVTGCAATLTSSTGVGELAGAIALTVTAGRSCTALLTVQALDGVTVMATTTAAVSARTGDVASLLSYWVPIVALAAVFVTGIRWGNWPLSYTAVLAFLTLLIPLPISWEWTVLMMLGVTMLPGMVRAFQNLADIRSEAKETGESMGAVVRRRRAATRSQRRPTRSGGRA